jgi:hypothetical protein
VQELGLYVLDPEMIVSIPQVRHMRCPPVLQLSVEGWGFAPIMTVISCCPPQRLVIEMVCQHGIDSIMITLLESYQTMTFRSLRDLEEYEREDGCVRWQQVY